MAREIREEKQGEVAQAPEEAVDSPTSPIQIQVAEEMEQTIIQIVREDRRKFTEARDKRDYGTTAKGKQLNFRDWFKGLQDLYNAKREPKTVPWKFCSNRSLRIATSIVDMLHSRMYPAVVNEDLVRWRPGESKDVPKVERITKLMSWWAWVRCRLRSFYDSWVKTVMGYGDALTETSWKVEFKQKGRSFSDPVLGEDGEQLTNPDGTPAAVSGFEPDRKESSTSKTYLRDQFLLQEGSTNIQEEPVIIEEEMLYRDLERGEAEGKFVNVTNLLRSRIMDMMPIGSNLTEEEADRVREAMLRNQSVKITREYMHLDVDGDGFAEDIRVAVSLEHDLYLGGIATRDLTYSGERPLDFTKIADRIEAPQENIGLGVLESIKELSEEIDAIFNQMSDGNTLSVMMPGFYDPGGDIDAPVLKLAPNKMTPVSSPNENIFFPTINVPTDKLILAIRLVMEFIERLTAANSTILGKQDELVGGSGTATRTAAIVQSAEQRFALPAERLREGASRILNVYLDLLQLNIPPGLETRVLGESGEPVFDAGELSREGIASEMDAYILADPSMGSKQTERELAGMFYSILLQNVIVGTDPAKIYKITADFLKSYGKNPEEYLGPEPNLDDIDTPEDENTLLVQGDFGRVRAQITENHIQHIRVHQDLIRSPSMAELASRAPHLHAQVIEAAEVHIMEHTQMLQVMMQLISQFGGGGKGGGNSTGNGTARTDAQGVPQLGGQPGLEQSPGPLGQALESKRTGKIQSPSSQ